YSHEKAKKIPSWLNVDQTDRKKIMAFLEDQNNIEKHLPQYNGIDPKLIFRTAHIEIFPFHPLNFSKKQTAVLFNYKNSDILGNAKTVVIEI
ncbi:MAG: hypothetical protein K0R90_1549, partial [Oscillospiraceae bacterium]|nr:hypothetical protein [Oscillospiraceae bacterium]